MDFCAVKKKKKKKMLVLGIIETVHRLDGVSGALRLLADVTLKTLVSNRMLPEETKRR